MLTTNAQDASYQGGEEGKIFLFICKGRIDYLVELKINWINKL